MRNRLLSTRLLPDQIAICFLGQAGVILQSGNQYLVIDAFLSGGLYRDGEPRGRNYPAPIHASELDFADYILCTHDHRDHMDIPSLQTIASVNPKAVFVLPAPAAGKVLSAGIPEDRIIRAHAGEKLTLGSFSVMPLPAAHETLETDANGDHTALGFLIGTAGIRLFHAGDTLIYDGLKELVGKTDICMLPVNGRSYYRTKRNIIGNMTLEEAVLFAQEAEAKLFIPMHYDMFHYNRMDPAMIPAALEQYAPDLCYKIFRPGERLIYAN